MEQKKQSNRLSRKLAVPFFLVLGALSVISFLIPLRPTQSRVEKRNLKEFPAFSLEALADGSYFDEIGLWFSDTFPGRESWLEAASFTKSLHGHSDFAIDGNLPMTMEEVPPTVPAYSEPVPTETAPTEPAQTVTVPPETTAPAETAQPETAAPTESTQPEPAAWGGVDAGDEAELLWTETVVQIGDSLFTPLGFSQVCSDAYIKVINRFTERVAPLGVTVISAPPPTAVGILIEDEFQEKLRSVSQSDTLRYLHDGMDERVVKVDTVSALLEHNSEYVYFRTDHHWTALGAYYSYCAVCEAIGMEPVDINTMRVWDQGEFTGSLYSRARYMNKLTHDNVYAYVPEGDIVNTAYTGMNVSWEYPVLADTTARELDCKYLTFGTDWPMNHLENRSLPGRPNVLVVKDSFGNCFTPFLTQNFSNVYAVDYRKFYELPLIQLVEQYDIDYVIFMPYLAATQSQTGPQYFDSLCR